MLPYSCMKICCTSRRAQGSSPASAEAEAAKLGLPPCSWGRQLDKTGCQTPMNLCCACMSAPRARLRQPQRVRLWPQCDPFCIEAEELSGLRKTVAVTDVRHTGTDTLCLSWGYYDTVSRLTDRRTERETEQKSHVQHQSQVLQHRACL